MNRNIFFVLLILAIASLACGFSIDLPSTPTAGPDITDQITVTGPIGDEASAATWLDISFGAGKLTLSPGAKDLVNGTATYNILELKPQITEKDGNIKSG